jgi:hypothetical protein
MVPDRRVECQSQVSRVDLHVCDGLAEDANGLERFETGAHPCHLLARGFEFVDIERLHLGAAESSGRLAGATVQRATFVRECTINERPSEACGRRKSRLCASRRDTRPITLHLVTSRSSANALVEETVRRCSFVSTKIVIVVSLPKGRENQISSTSAICARRQKTHYSR